MDFKIEKNIQMPKKNFTGKYPFADMEIGDSFFITHEGMSATQILYQNNNIRRAAKNAGMRASIRTVEGGFRVWRVK